MSVVAGEHEQGVAGGVGEVLGDTCGEVLLEGGGGAGAGEVEEFGGEVEGGGGEGGGGWRGR